MGQRCSVESACTSTSNSEFVVVYDGELIGVDLPKDRQHDVTVRWVLEQLIKRQPAEGKWEAISLYEYAQLLLLFFALHLMNAHLCSVERNFPVVNLDSSALDLFYEAQYIVAIMPVDTLVGIVYSVYALFVWIILLFLISILSHPSPHIC